MRITDTGTRYRHYCDLLDLWEMGLELLRERNLSPENKIRIKQLEASSELLRKQIDILTGYEPGQYSDALFPIKRMIDTIPRNILQPQSGAGAAE